MVLQHIGSNLGYTGRGANAFGKAVRDPMRLTYALCVAFLIAIGTPANALTPSALSTGCDKSRFAPAQLVMKEVQDLFDFMAARHPIGGMTVGIVCGPDLVWSKSYGYADMETGKAANRDTVYRIGSITKQFTGLMLLQLVDAGKVKLSDPVEKYFPDIRNVEGNAALAKPITLEQLATHRAGLSREPDDQRFLVGPVVEWDEITRSALPHVKYQFEPGTSYSYSNVGYAILGAALSRAAGQPYTDYVQQRILSPLGMRHTGFERNAEMLADLAKGYVVVNGRGDPTFAAGELQAGRGYKVPNGALFTTIDDLAKFVSFEMGAGPEAVLDSPTLNENFARGYPTGPDTKTRCGTGFFLLQIDHHAIIGHSGSVAGYMAGAYFDPAARIGIIYLRSSSDRAPDEGAVFRSLSLLAETP
jgi:CubicO group peptidase (beta-lactamase class C family)